MEESNCPLVMALGRPWQSRKTWSQVSLEKSLQPLDLASEREEGAAERFLEHRIDQGALFAEVA